MEHVANDDDDVDDNITIIHIINAGNNNNNNNNNNILHRQTKLMKVVKSKYVGKTVTNILHSRQYLSWQRNFCLLGRRKSDYLAHKNPYPCHILGLIEFYTVKVTLLYGSA